MDIRFYNKLNNIFITLSIFLVILVCVYDSLFNIVPQIILLFGSISAIINGKFKFKKYNKVSFKEQFTFGILFAIYSFILIIGAIFSILS